MCYYNSIKVSKSDYVKLMTGEILIAEYDASMQSGFEYGNWPLVFNKQSKVVSELAHWEFIPFLYQNMDEVKASRKKYTTLNAKGETLLTSKIYKEAAHHRRCLVLSSGFYEGRHFENKAYPYHIKIKGANLFYMAGIWQNWTIRKQENRWKHLH